MGYISVRRAESLRAKTNSQVGAIDVSRDNGHTGTRLPILGDSECDESTLVTVETHTFQNTNTERAYTDTDRVKKYLPAGFRLSSQSSCSWT